MNKKLVSIIAGLLFLMLVSSVQGLVLTPSSGVTNTYENKTKTVTILLNNTHNFTIYNITFSDLPYVNFPIVAEMQTNTTYDYKFNVTTFGKFTETYTSYVYFSYMAEVTHPQTNYSIEITDVGFIPQNLSVREDDVITLRNIDIVDHTIRIDGNDIILEPDENRSFLFGSARTVTYFDIDTSKTGFIYIRDKTLVEPVHNTAFDKSLSITMNANYNEAFLHLEIFTSVFTLNYNEIAEGVIKISSFNSTAHNVNLAGQWIDFKENNFDLNASGSRIVFFNLTPRINYTNQTNKTYLINVNATAENSELETEQIHLTINYHDFGETTVNTTNQTVIFVINKEYIKEYCEQFPEDCPTTEVYVNTTVKEVTTEAQALLDLKEEIARSTAERRGDVTTTQDDGNVEGEMVDLKKQVLQVLKIFDEDILPRLEKWEASVEREAKEARSARIKKIWTNIGWSIFSLVVASAVGLYIYNKKQKDKEAKPY